MSDEEARVAEVVSKCERVVYSCARHWRSRWIGEDEAISLGFLALLRFARKKRAWNDERHMIRSAAQAVKWAIIDAHRRQSGRRARKTRPWLFCDLTEAAALAVENAGARDEPADDTLDRICELLADERDRAMARMRMAGATYREIAERFGVTGSRVFQIWAERIEPAARAALNGTRSRSSVAKREAVAAMGESMARAS